MYLKQKRMAKLRIKSLKALLWNKQIQKKLKQHLETKQLILMSRALSAIQINVDLQAQTHSNYLVYMRHKRSAKTKLIIRTWLKAARMANEDELKQFIKVRYFRKLIRVYNKRVSAELQRAYHIRRILLKKWVFGALKRNVSEV